MFFETPIRSSSELPPELTLSALREACLDSAELMEMYADLVDCAHRYYEAAVNFEYLLCCANEGFFTDEKRCRIGTSDEVRRITHTSLCAKLRILARTMFNKNHGPWWMRQIVNDTNNREVVGRWAIRQITEKNKQEVSHVPVYGCPVEGFTDQGTQTSQSVDSFGM